MKTTSKKAMREIKLNSAKDLIWRNLPNHPATFGQCFTCASGARGGGLCIDCAERELAEIVGEELACKYRHAIEDARQLEREMEGKIWVQLATSFR